MESGGFLEVSAAVMQKDIEVIMSAFKGTGIVEKVTQVLAETVADPDIPGSVILATMPGAAIGVPISAQVPSLWDTLSSMRTAELERGRNEDIENLRKLGTDTYSWFRAGGVIGYEALFGVDNVKPFT